MAFSVDSADHVEVLVRDLDTSIRWYKKVLGLREIRRWEPHPVMIGVGDTMLALFSAEADAAPAPGANDCSPMRWLLVAWRVDPERFGEAQEHLKKCGIPFRGPIDHGGSQSIYFTDPDGHPLEITYYLP